jgi:hypothetical protein
MSVSVERGFEVPILLLVFNRPAHTQRLMAVLQQIRPTRLYVHADGPRPSRVGELERSEETRSLVLSSINWPCEVNTLFREENAGLRAGVYGAINWFFEAEEYGIILEDDCIPALSFFGYCEELLVKYRWDEQVMHIGASNLVEEWTRDLEADYQWTHFSLVWGWASWRRAWEKMDIGLSHLDSFKGMDGFLTSQWAGTYLMDKFAATKAGRNQSWAYAWFFSILYQRGYCILPTVNLVQNVGVGDEQATHTTKRNTSAARTAGSVQLPLRHPDRRAIQPVLEMRLFYATQKPKFRLWIWHLLRLFGRR